MFKTILEFDPQLIVEPLKWPLTLRRVYILTFPISGCLHLAIFGIILWLLIITIIIMWPISFAVSMWSKLDEENLRNIPIPNSGEQECGH